MSSSPKKNRLIADKIEVSKTKGTTQTVPFSFTRKVHHLLFNIRTISFRISIKKHLKEPLNKACYQNFFTRDLFIKNPF
jgi:hypothetical protein